MKTGRIFFALLCLYGLSRAAFAVEPNETFATATLLSGGVATISDSLSAGTSSAPDTLLGSIGLFGDVEFTNDDGGPYASTLGSALGAVPTNNGVIDFYVTGYTDLDFNGAHGEIGAYQITVRAYDFFGDLVNTIVQNDALEAGVADRFKFDNANWIGGDYDVIVNNTIGSSSSGGDVDFFRFSGLTPGANFTAETSDPSGTGIDTVLGFFSGAGALLASNDDIDESNLRSRVTWQVPANGQVYLAVTGFGDNAFGGVHNIVGDYDLTVSLNGPLRGDYSNNGEVDAADYTVYRDGLGTTFTTTAYTTWRNNFGAGAVVVASQAVPEPRSLVVVLLAGLVVRSTVGWVLAPTFTAAYETTADRTG